MADVYEGTFDERRIIEENELWRALDELSESKKKIVKKTVEDAAFKSVLLEDLHAIIEEEGVIEEYTNGASQSGRKMSSNVQVYNALEKSYQNQIKLLLSALPVQPLNPESDGFDEFVRKRD